MSGGPRDDGEPNARPVEMGEVRGADRSSAEEASGWSLNRDPDLVTRRLGWIAALADDRAVDGVDNGVDNGVNNGAGGGVGEPSADSGPSPSRGRSVASAHSRGEVEVETSLPTTPSTDASISEDQGSSRSPDGCVVSAGIDPFADVAETQASVTAGPDGTSVLPATAGPRRRWRRVVRVVLGGLSVGVIYLLATYIQVHRAGSADQRRSVEAIVVLGAAQYDGRPSPQLAARLDHAAALFAQGWAPVVMVTGGRLEGDRYTEAGASAFYLIDAGVPPEAILQEDQGRSTFESLDRAADLLRTAEIDEVLLVTDPYHALRSRLIAEEVGLDAVVSSTRTSPVRGATAVGREAKEAAGIAVGRIIGFERLLRITG